MSRRREGPACTSNNRTGWRVRWSCCGSAASRTVLRSPCSVLSSTRAALRPPRPRPRRLPPCARPPPSTRTLCSRWSTRRRTRSGGARPATTSKESGSGHSVQTTLRCDAAAVEREEERVGRRTRDLNVEWRALNAERRDFNAEWRTRTRTRRDEDEEGRGRGATSTQSGGAGAGPGEVRDEEKELLHETKGRWDDGRGRGRGRGG